MTKLTIVMTVIMIKDKDVIVDNKNMNNSNNNINKYNNHKLRLKAYIAEEKQIKEMRRPIRMRKEIIHNHKKKKKSNKAQ